MIVKNSHMIYFHNSQKGDSFIYIMQSSKISVNNNGKGINSALDEAENFAKSLNLNHKNKFHIRLLTEEVMELVKSILGDFNADFWIDEENNICSLHLQAQAKINYPQKQELLSVSTTGENIANRSIMDKVKEIISAGVYGMEGINILPGGEAIQTPYVWYYTWNSSSSKNHDELEKYIIGNIADEVKVGINKNNIELIIILNVKEH